MNNARNAPRARPLVFVSLLLGLISAAPATQSRSTPQSAVVQICIAIRAEDKKALERLFTVAPGDIESEAWLAVLLDSAVARQRLHRVSLAKFGVTLSATEDVGGNIFVSKRTIEQAERMMAGAKIEISDDVARITCDWSELGKLTTEKPAEQAAPATFVFRRVASDWKVDVSAMLASQKSKRDDVADAESNRRQQELFREALRRTVKAWNDIAAGIEAGEFSSAADANAALKVKR